MSAQDFEAGWWGNCANTFHEEEKQTVYARHMALDSHFLVPGAAHPPTYDLGGRRVLDIGGGPVSMLLKTVNSPLRAVIDPCPYPRWVGQRYDAAGIEYMPLRGEDLALREAFDEVWIYNVLQHVDDPGLVIERAWAALDSTSDETSVIRMFEWIGVPAHEGHPHELTEAALNGWLGRAAPGYVAQVNERGAVGRAFCGIFGRTW